MQRCKALRAELNGKVDMGYDVSDYKDIHEPYGTVQDVERLARELLPEA